jgi:hypothetical protein
MCFDVPGSRRRGRDAEMGEAVSGEGIGHSERLLRATYYARVIRELRGAIDRDFGDREAELLEEAREMLGEFAQAVAACLDAP